MNILIDNFSNNRDSTCLYLYNECQKLKKINTSFWTTKAISTYDIFDDVKPDVFITHCKSLSQEVAMYIDDQSTKKGMIVVLFISGISQEEIDYIASTPMKENSQILLACTDKQKIKTSLKQIYVRDCADDNITNAEVDYKIPKAYHVIDNSIIKKQSGSYHYLSNQNGVGDISMPQQTLSSLYYKYEQILFEGYEKFDQSFFDALHRVPEVYYTSDKKELDELSEKLFGCVLNYKNKGKVDFDKVKKTIKEKHLPRNRVKQLLSQLPINQENFIDF
tara:strand:+ start:5169 stop:5999 length:831 start_codon:yes stop_codon:yes gene_type:complete